MATPSDNHVMDASSAVVTLDVYSGKPNPTWSLSDADTTKLLQRLRALPASSLQAGPGNDSLGYRSISAEIHERSKPVIVVTASRGVVTVERDGARSLHADAGCQFELWLVNTGAAHIAPDLLRYVTGEVAAHAKLEAH